MRFAVVGIAFFLLLLRLSAFGHFPVVALCICWGLAITIFNLVFQSEIIRLAPEATAIAMSVYSGIYNVGIGAGALVGGFVCTHASIARVGYAGGAIALLAALFCLVRLVPLVTRRRGGVRTKNRKRPAIGEVAGRCVFRGADRSGRISGASWSGAIQPVASRSDRGA